MEGAGSSLPPVPHQLDRGSNDVDVVHGLENAIVVKQPSRDHRTRLRRGVDPKRRAICKRGAEPEEKLRALDAYVAQGLREGTFHYYRGKLDRFQALEAVNVGLRSAVAKIVEGAMRAYDEKARLSGYVMQSGLAPFYLPEGSQRELVFLTINKCIEDSAPIWKHNRIIQAIIAKKIGFGRAALTPHLDVIEYFNDTYGCREANEAAVDAKVEAAIKNSIDAREVEISSGKLEHRDSIREAIPEAFTTRARQSRMRALFEKYDRQAVEAGYISIRKEGLLATLRELLASGAYTNEDYGTALLAPLLARLGVPSWFVEAREVIASFERQTIERLDADPFIIKIDGRYFSFAQLFKVGYPRDYVEALAKAFHQSYRDRSRLRVGPLYNWLTRLLIWIQQQPGTIAAVATSIHLRGVITDLDWLYVLLQFRDNTNEANRQEIVNSLNAVTRKLSVHGLLPRLLSGIPKGVSVKPTVTIRSFAEVPAQRAPEDYQAAVGGFMGFIENLTNSNNLSLFAEADRLDSRNFYEALKQDFLVNGKEGPLEVVAATKQLIERRQCAFGDCFKSVIASSVQRLEEGEILADQGVDPDVYWDQICDVSLDRSTRLKIRREFFPNPDTADQTALKNLLRLTRDRFKRKAPLNGDEAYWFFKTRYLEIAPASEVQSYLLPSNDMIMACASIYMQGSGANLPVGRNLLENCYQECDDKNFRKVVGFKPTANGKPIIYYFELNSDENLALQAALKWGKYLRDIAPPAHQDLMFLQKVGSRIQPLYSHAHRAFFDRHRRMIECLKDVPLTPQMWRPTLLLMCAIDKGGKLATALAMAQHTEGVSPHYYDRFPLRLMHEVRLRHFKELLEAAVVHAIPGAPAFISLDPTVIDARLSEAIDVGIGVACADPYARSTDQTSICEALDCFRCKQMRIAIDAESLSWLIVWRASLEQAEGDWVRDHPDRWEDEFLPFLCLVEVVEELMSPPMFLPIWREAEEIAGQKLCDPEFQPYQPWS